MICGICVLITVEKDVLGAEYVSRVVLTLFGYMRRRVCISCVFKSIGEGFCRGDIYVW